MFTKNIFTKKDPIADLIKDINEADYNLKVEQLKGKQHKIDANKNGKIDADDFEILRGKKKVDEAGSPFDKDYKSQVATKPGEKAGFDSKKVSTGTVYSRKPPKPETTKEEVESIDEEVLGGHTVTPGSGMTNKLREIHKKLSKKGYKIHGSLDHLDPSYTGGARTFTYKKDGHPDISVEKQGFERHVEVSMKKDKPANLPGRSKNESVEIEEADNLTMRGLHTANPQSIPGYMRSTEKGKKSLADKNKPVLKDMIKRQLGKHPKPNLPEEVELHEATTVVGKATKTGADKKGQKLGAMSAAVEGVKTEHEHEGKKYTVHSGVDRDGDVHHSVIHDGKQVHNHLVSPDGEYGDKPSPLHKKLIADHVASAKKHLDKMAGHIFSDEDDEHDMHESVENLGEAELSAAEVAKKEKLVKSMKKGMAGFKERYGKRWKDVMYATATARAKKSK